ncbi:FAD-dependent oxidoreductase [Puniceicoccus vermicola]|uniref:FAD-dependent oxidoreductase n=2 Tax=Puniceicoccus vermicola TaxID=388746 RepID=A0A7X1B1E4_9BACT|nr:FAD-dependent oxidoreductase [Puniceicoccus vermicola]
MNQKNVRPRVSAYSDYDVIVVGGGPTGCTAAAAAAREGAKTLLIESTAMLGGSGTGALVPAWCPFSDKKQIIYRGLAETVLNRCKEHQAHVSPEDLDWVPIDPELLKRVYDELLAENGAEVLFQTQLCSVETDKSGTVEAILVANKGGLSRIRAKTFIDATGDADLCAWAGAEFHKGDEQGDLMPATHCFILSNVDEKAFRETCDNGRRLMGNHPETRFYEIIESDQYPLIQDAHACCNLIGPGTVGFNAGHIWNVDNTDSFSVSKGLAIGRQLASQFHQAFSEYYPEAFGKSFLVTTGSVLGIRESRRIVGDYSLTLDDYIQRRSFEDEIGRNCYFIDIHHSLKEAEEHVKEKADGLSTPALHYGPGESHGIPFHCLIPRDLKNVIVAGRSISCDRHVQGSVRVMPVCLTMGEAAGTAAAMSQKDGGAIRSVSVPTLREKLRHYGAYLPELSAESVSS